MAGRGLYQLLLEALQGSRPGMAADDPAEIARSYPQNGGANSADAEAQTRFLPPVDVPLRDPNFRQLSRASFAAQAKDPGKLNVQSNSPDYLWTASPTDAGSAGANGRPALPWWALSPSPILPLSGGRSALLRAGGLGRSISSSWPTSTQKIPMPEISEAGKIFGVVSMLHPDLLRQRLLDELDKSKGAGGAADPILELNQARRREAGSKAGNRGGISVRKKNTDVCDWQRDQEEKRCIDRKDEYFHKDHLSACMGRAIERWAKCYQTGEIPKWPPEWGPADEDAWINEAR